ncbi:MAG: DGQHR domain-containing protein [Candidatus Bathyarchaeota archaeon]|jgi:DGQHR domain-containing protein
MRLKAFSIKQKGAAEETDLYLTSLPALKLIDRYTIDRWTPDNTRGYQRLPMESRFGRRRRSILRYLLRELGCFPTSVLVNIRGELNYQEEIDLGWASLGTLDIPDEERFWLLDGQHRVEALRRAIQTNPQFEGYPVILSILKLPERFDELMFFYLVNRRQRGVAIDLVYRHLQRMLKEKGEDWLYNFEGQAGVYRGKAAGVVDLLNEEPGSPWKGGIRIVTEERREEHIVRDKLMITTIAKIMRNRACRGVTLEETADLLIDYWNAVSKLYPGVFENPRPYTLLGPQGIISLHRLFPDTYRWCTNRGIVNEERMRAYLELLQTETPEHETPAFRPPLELRFWSKKHGPLEAVKTDRESIRELYDNLRIKLAIAGETKPSPA